MSRLQPLDPATATGTAKELLDRIQAAFGVTPNMARVRAAGYDDRDIAAIVGHVALNVLTNYFNLVAQTEVDFP